MEHQHTNARRHARRSMIEMAELRVKHQIRPYHCIIRDLSDGGARLRVPMDFPTQGEVRLISPAVGIDREVRVVWRTEHSMGVSFEAAA